MPENYSTYQINLTEEPTNTYATEGIGSGETETILTAVDVRGGLSFEGVTLENNAYSSNQYAHGIYVGTSWPGWNAGEGDPGWLLWEAIPAHNSDIAWAPSTDVAASIVQYPTVLRWRGQRPLGTNLVFYGWAYLSGGPGGAEAAWSGTVLARWDRLIF
jgi:hypothetical protein